MAESPMHVAPPAETPAAVTPPAEPATVERLNLLYHLIIGVAMGLVAPFTVFAWPFAILTGMVIGQAEVRRMHGQPPRGTVLRIVALIGGGLAMLIFGAILGGLIAILVVALAAYSERVAGKTSAIDQSMARILIVIVAFVTWFSLLYVLKLNVNINIGG